MGEYFIREEHSKTKEWKDNLYYGIKWKQSFLELTFLSAKTDENRSINIF